LLFVVGLSGALPSAAFAQDDAGSNPMIYLPALRNSAAQQTPDGSSGLVTADVSAAEQAAAARFWTRERMLSAQSLDRLVVDGEISTDANAAQRDAARPGPKGAVAGSLPDKGALALAQSLYAEEWARMAADDAASEAAPLALPSLAPASTDDSDAFASVPPFASYYVNDNAATWKSFPWITMGRLFFQIPGLSGTYACSGAAAYGRAVWTAGHCVYTTGRGWSYNMYFVPAYRNGAWPYGSFTVKSRTALSQWVSSANLAYDIGMVAVNDKSGLKLSQWVGSVGFMWNQSATQLFHAFGYPTNYASAQYLVTCAAGTYTRDPLVGPDPIGIGCDMGSGSSGGPWMVGYAPFKGGLTNYINGVVAYSYSTRPLEIFSPYFGAEAKALYDWGRVQ
jgi:V8-like Glu-specific endopeptidase